WRAARLLGRAALPLDPPTERLRSPRRRCDRWPLGLEQRGVGSGAFDWIRRMGVHKAYHLDPTNRLIHWICIPIELAAVVKLLSLVPGPVDLALAAIVLVG